MANIRPGEVPASQGAPAPEPAAANGNTIRFTDEKADATDMLDHVPTNQTDIAKDQVQQDPLAALGIPDWQVLERKVVRRLDMTLLPQLWILYMFNYLNRTNIA